MNRNGDILFLAMLLGACLLVPEAANAHTGAGISGGFLSGFAHPILGWDHVVAMVAVGLWGAFLRGPAAQQYVARPSGGATGGILD
jgi:urease accessory protein